MKALSKKQTKIGANPFLWHIFIFANNGI